MIGTLSWSVGTSLTAPGNDPISARLAEWGRNHALGPVITLLESFQYKLNAPHLGGSVTISNSDTGTIASALTPLKSLNDTTIPGEGVFHPLILQNSLPIIESAQIRPDKIHTSYLATVVWMNGAHTNFQLRPGFSEPGKISRFFRSDHVTLRESNLLATFNSGFKLAASGGGFYLNGVVAKPLTSGTASLVTFVDGTSQIGVWGRDFKVSSRIVSVRQNLKLLIDRGKVASNIGSAVQSNWGATLGFKDYVWRSGIGETASGDFVYVCGDALSAESLANILKDAGAEEAMQLDINPEWISYMWFNHNSKSSLPIKVATFNRPADRYLSSSSRDFYAVYAR